MTEGRKRFRMMDGPPARDVVNRVIGAVRLSASVSCTVLEIKDHVATVEISGPVTHVERVYKYGADARLW